MVFFILLAPLLNRRYYFFITVLWIQVQKKSTVVCEIREKKTWRMLIDVWQIAFHESGKHCGIPASLPINMYYYKEKDP